MANIVSRTLGIRAANAIEEEKKEKNHEEQQGLEASVVSNGEGRKSKRVVEKVNSRKRQRSIGEDDEPVTPVSRKLLMLPNIQSYMLML